ncbi:cupredoxin domain-containing protein [Candidatus Microgenomates bacterium]|nr:cupredoxin domain-containing protein [Candidatus Microgenomates bacterium]
MITIENKELNPVIIVGVVLALVVVGGVFVFMNGNKTTGKTATNQQPTTTTQNTQTTTPTGPVKEFTVDGSSFKFNPSKITVNKGDTVKITFKDDDGTHNLVIDGYSVSTKIIQGGAQDTVQFVADKSGSFEYYCSVGKHKELGMTGTLIVN